MTYEEKQVECIDTLWRAVHEIKSRVSAARTLETLATPDELQDALKGGGPEAVTEWFEQCRTDFDSGLDSLKAEDANLCRPFVSERLWKLFWALKVLNGRLAFLMYQSINTEHYRDWKDDTALSDAISTVLPDATIAEARSTRIGSIDKIEEAIFELFAREARAMLEAHRNVD